MSGTLKVLAVAGAALVAVAATLASLQVLRLAEANVRATSALTPLTGERQELLGVDLLSSSQATFEACAADPLDAERWSGALTLRVRRVGGDTLVEMPLTEGVLEYARRSEGVACLVLAFDEAVPVGGRYVIEAVPGSDGLPADLVGTPFVVRAQGQRAFGSLEATLILVVLLGALVALMALALSRRDGDAPQTRGHWTRLGVALVALVAVAAALYVAPLPSSWGGLARGGGLALAQVALALLFIGGALRSRPSALGLDGPRERRWLLWLAPVIGIALWYGGDLLQQTVPSTAPPPMAAMMTSPAGMLTVAVLAVVVPLAEEIFFRGFLYGLVARRGGEIAAVAVTVLCFSAAHLAQTWGAWGSVSSVVATGVVLTLLRAATGTVVVPALVHVIHNGAVVVLVLLAARG